MKKIFHSLLITLLLTFFCGMTVLASPVCKEDGTWFDAEYYADHNPDVKAQIGTDAGRLYQHYQVFGKAEGRKAVDVSRIPARDVEREAIRVSELELLNKIRAEHGLQPFKLNYKASKLADIRCRECMTMFEHTRPDGRDCFSLLDDNGVDYYTAGENIAYGQRSVEEVVEDWMNSPGHRANILTSDFKEIGIGYDDNYWAQYFLG